MAVATTGSLANVAHVAVVCGITFWVESTLSGLPPGTLPKGTGLHQPKQTMVAPGCGIVKHKARQLLRWLVVTTEFTTQSHLGSTAGHIN